MAATGLSREEREEIRAGIEREETFQVIADRIKRHRSTVSQEVARNGGRRHYRAVVAERRAKRRRRRPKRSKFVQSSALADHVSKELKAGYSPMAISMRLRRGGKFSVSHETIYRGVYDLDVRPLLGLPSQVLRTRRRFRRKRSTRKQERNVLRQFKPITQRPAIASKRIEFGHWEGDLIVGQANHSQLITLVERVSRFTIVLPLESKFMGKLNRVLEPVFKKLPTDMRKTITWDQGSEMAAWSSLESRLGLSVYFCKAASPWQRPSNENTNRHLRFWFPKNSDLKLIDVRDIRKATRVWNSQPRRTLNWQTSQEVYTAAIRALTA